MTVLDHVPVERITAEAERVHVGRLLLTLVAGFFYLIGWIVAKVFVAVVWCAVAVKVGFQEGRKAGGRRGPAG